MIILFVSFKVHNSEIGLIISISRWRNWGRECPKSPTVVRQSCDSGKGLLIPFHPYLLKVESVKRWKPGASQVNKSPSALAGPGGNACPRGQGAWSTLPHGNSRNQAWEGSLGFEGESPRDWLYRIWSLLSPHGDFVQRRGMIRGIHFRMFMAVRILSWNSALNCDAEQTPLQCLLWSKPWRGPSRHLH